MKPMTQADANKWVENAHKIRGQIIAEYCKLESNIVYSLIYFFTKDDDVSNDIIEVLLDRLTFEEKRASLNSMLQREEDKNEHRKKHMYASLMTEIQKLSPIRNQFAHYPLPDFVDSHETSVINLLKYRDGVKQLEFNQEEIDDLIARIRKAANDVFFINL